MRILAVLDTYPVLSETFLYTLLENLQAAGMDATIRARRRGKSPHRPALKAKYLPSDESPAWVKFVLLGWYTLRLLIVSPRAFEKAMGYLHNQSGGMRARFAIAYRIFPLLCEKADLTYFSFGGLAVKYVDYFSLNPNSFFSLRGSDINIEPLLDVKYAEALTLALQKTRGVHCVSRDIQAKAVRMCGEEAGKFQVIHTSVNPVFLDGYENLNANDANTRIGQGKLAKFVHSRNSRFESADFSNAQSDSHTPNNPSLRAFAAKQSPSSRRLLRREDHPPRNDENGDHPPHNDVCIVSSGRLDWRKGYEHGMMAVRELVNRGVDCSWTIIGEGPHRLALEWAARDMNLTERVTFLGGKSQSEIAQIYRGAHIFFHPSVSEGLSNSVLEAMAAGLPVVVSNVGGMNEAVEHAAHGYLVPPRNWREMADALEKLACNESLRHEMGESARAHVLAEFTREKQVAGFKSLFGLPA